jgi:hypothetical protein
VPGRSGLAGSTAEAVARGLGRAQSSSRQSLSGLRPLGLRMEVCHSFIVITEPLGLFFVVDPQISFIRYPSILLFLVISSSSWIQIFNKHK